MKFLVNLIQLTIFAISFFAFPVSAQSKPEDVARDAFYAQTAGDYDRLSALYDVSITSFFSSLADQLIESSSSDQTSKSALESMFKTTDHTEIHALGDQKIFARMFAYIFSTKLTPEEQELMSKAQFEYLETVPNSDKTADVRYVVAFTPGVKTEPKTMLLSKNGDEWRITMKPELLQAIKAAINGSN